MKNNQERQQINLGLLIRFLAIPSMLAILVYFGKDFFHGSQKQKKTNCDFLDDYSSGLLLTTKYHENNGSLFEQHRKCKRDTSVEAREKQLYHDARTILAFEKVSGNSTVASIYGSSSLDVCDSLWRDTAHISYELRKREIVVWQGGGAGVMEAARYGSDAYSFGLSLALLDDIIQSKCSEKTASADAKNEIETLVKSDYTVQKSEGSYSVHGIPWLGRMSKLSYIGAGTWRAELYSIYSVLQIMAENSDIWIDIESPVTSYGTDLENTAGGAQIGYKPYLSQDKSQIAIHYGPNGYMPERRDQTYVKSTETVGQLTKYVDSVVIEKICHENRALGACKGAFYSPVLSESECGNSCQRRL